ncbi:bacterio-opsin activator domain-containing protein [Halapricum desulfuricans]|uniref:Light- and oxygen-sensing transcriptionregulator n=1 Tax=Halapricum desulfuricans TaxID=2841257 RepID=A0A897MX01_9EURY|nr:bacterio-opsin activator domain-containing protein [Halapricum desulfuricans]QSG04994.1 Putative light- and oxygen-sensing transcriptionregulator [Halapricum desulfuricans]
MDDRLQAAPIGVLTVSSDGTVTEVNDAAGELIGGDPSGDPIEEALPRSVDDSLLAALDGETTETTFEEYYPTIDRWLAVSVTPADRGATVYLRDVSERRRAARTAERFRAERERAAVIDEAQSAVLAALVGSSSRDEIEETIVRELGERDRWTFAWIGARGLDGDGLTVRAVAGETGDAFSAVRGALDGPDATPEERAVETGRARLAQPIADDPDVPETVRLAAFGDGVQSVLAVPLAYGSTVYGVAGVYTDRTDAFSERERRSFETLGEIAGFAVTAARNRELLLSDTVTEVTLGVDAETPLSIVATELETAVTLRGLVAHESDAVLCYVTAADARPEAVEAAASDIPAVGHARVTSETVEIELVGSTPLRSVTSLGATVREATYDRSGGRLVIELPPGSDVRRTVRSLARDHEADVLAKRERERSVTTAREFRDGLSDRLTDRQETVLRTAYLADYFESPRGSTAEEVASSLDITGSTLLYHLRAGQRTLLETFFDDRSS